MKKQKKEKPLILTSYDEEAVAELAQESIRMDERLSGLNVKPSSLSQQTAAVYGMTNNELYAAWQRAMQA